MHNQKSNSIAEQLLFCFSDPQPAHTAEGTVQRQLAVSAEVKFSETDTPFEEIQRYYDRAIDVLYAVHSGARRDNGQNDFEVWRHEERLVGDNSLAQRFLFNADELRYATHEYLDQPLRSEMLDLILLDSMAACETHEFFRYAHAEQGFPRELRDPSSMYVFIRSTAWVVAVLGGVWGAIYLLIPSWIPLATTILVIVGLVLILFVLIVSVSYGNERRKKKKNNRNLIRQMLDAYYAIPRGPPFSHRELRRIFQRTGDAGVSWPSAIFAVLDDIESR